MPISLSTRVVAVACNENGDRVLYARPRSRVHILNGHLSLGMTCEQRWNIRRTERDPFNQIDYKHFMPVPVSTSSATADSITTQMLGVPIYLR